MKRKIARMANRPQSITVEEYLVSKEEVKGAYRKGALEWVTLQIAKTDTEFDISQYGLPWQRKWRD